MKAAILAGGQSRRMGRDKALIEVGGELLLVRTARLAAEACSEVAVIGREAPPDWPLPDVRFHVDEQPGTGPLEGLRTALHHLDDDVLLLACDLPRLDGEAMSWLLARAAASRAELGMVTRGPDKLEPLFSCYRRAALAPVERAQRDGLLSLRGLISRGGFDFVDAPGWLDAKLFNMNAPEDLALLS